MLSRNHTIFPRWHKSSGLCWTSKLFFCIFLFIASWHSNAQESIPFNLSWRFVTGGKISFKPAVDHIGVIYIASDDRKLYAILPSGKEKWGVRLDSRPSCSPVIGYRGLIYIGTESGILSAFAPNGRLSWRFKSNSGACLNPVLGTDGTVYLPTRGGALFALDFRGREKWRYQFKSEISAAPSIGLERILYVSSSDRRLTALEPEGRKKWEIDLHDRGGTPAISENGTIYVNASGIQSISPDGAVLWSYLIPAQTADPVIMPGGILVAGARNGKLYAISPEGEKLWDIKIGIITAPAAVTEESIFVSSENDRMYAVSPHGVFQWAFKAKQAAHSPATGKDGSIYFGSDDWILYALKEENASIINIFDTFDGAWPAAFHDSHNTGRLTGLKDLDSAAALILKEFAFSDSRELKFSALDEIEEYLDGKKYLAIHVSTLEEVLGYLVSEGVTHRTYEYGRIISNFPLIRIKACSLLGRLATGGALDILIEAIRRDSDPDVRVQAVRAVGEIGLDPYGYAAQVLAYKLRQGAGEQYALAAIKTAQLLIMNGGIYPDVFNLLVAAANEGYTKRVRQSALAVLREVSKGVIHE